MNNNNRLNKSWYERRMEKLQDAGRAAARRVAIDAWADVLVIAEGKLKKMFEEAVDRFYADYTPGSFWDVKDDNGGHAYDRNYSLYDIYKLEITQANNNPDMQSFYEEFDNEEMTPFRSGYNGEDGLFETVFIRGWHGGATKGGTSNFFWRIPYPYYTMWFKSAAERAYPSPYEDFTKHADEYWYGGELVEDYFSMWSKNEYKLSKYLKEEM